MADMNKRVLDCDDDCEGERGERGKRGKRGHRGHDGHDGNDGNAGATGATGSTGATGATGDTGSTAIIPFASGTPVVLSEVLEIVGEPLVETCAVIGFGSSAPATTLTGELVGGQLNLTGTPPGSLLDMAWTMPRDGTLEQLSGFYSNIVNVDAINLPPGNTFVTLQIYRSIAPDSNIFDPYGPILQLTPPYTGVLGAPPGLTATGTIDLGGLPVTNQDRLVLVACVDNEALDPNLTLAVALTGYISAGLEIG